MALMSLVTDSREQTGLGNYFVANYPPFSAWKPEHLPAAQAALDRLPRPNTPLGLYLHIPFCRKRCKFCYFRVYTDKNADDVTTYNRALIREVELYARRPCVGGRSLEFVYFGGGTPSYLSASQLRNLITQLQSILPWTQTKEVTFECEPGTLQLHKLETLKELGVTRLSLGIENFNDAILEANGRAHLSAEIDRALAWARQCGFDQINIDLIAGMVGETWDNWRDCVQKTIALAPESITVYPMELPYNTEFSKSLHVIDPNQPSLQIADWPTKRAWVAYAFAQFFAHGYERSSAYTAVRKTPDRRPQFVYRDSLWHGADMFGTGVASFGHVNGVHMQNLDRWDDYLRAILERNELPLQRALPVDDRELLTREVILQLKTGRLEADYFRDKFGVDVAKEFDPAWHELQVAGLAEINHRQIRLTDDGFLQIDRYLPAFFAPQYRDRRYT
jgi:oxygen-independent coproporphyrinogen-3 oxidase